jgi:hypothetical protein
MKDMFKARDTIYIKTTFNNFIPNGSINGYSNGGIIKMKVEN